MTSHLSGFKKARYGKEGGARRRRGGGDVRNGSSIQCSPTGWVDDICKVTVLIDNTGIVAPGSTQVDFLDDTCSGDGGYLFFFKIFF